MVRLFLFVFVALSLSKNSFAVCSPVVTPACPEVKYWIDEAKKALANGNNGLFQELAEEYLWTYDHNLQETDLKDGSPAYYKRKAIEFLIAAPSPSVWNVPLEDNPLRAYIDEVNVTSAKSSLAASILVENHLARLGLREHMPDRHGPRPLTEAREAGPIQLHDPDVPLGSLKSYLDFVDQSLALELREASQRGQTAQARQDANTLLRAAGYSTNANTKDFIHFLREIHNAKPGGETINPPRRMERFTSSLATLDRVTILHDAESAYALSGEDPRTQYAFLSHLSNRDLHDFILSVQHPDTNGQYENYPQHRLTQLGNLVDEAKTVLNNRGSYIQNSVVSGVHQYSELHREIELGWANDRADNNHFGTNDLTLFKRALASTEPGVQEQVLQFLKTTHIIQGPPERITHVAQEPHIDAILSVLETIQMNSHHALIKGQSSSIFDTPEFFRWAFDFSKEIQSENYQGSSQLRKKVESVIGQLQNINSNIISRSYGFTTRSHLHNSAAKLRFNTTPEEEVFSRRRSALALASHVYDSYGLEEFRRRGGGGLKPQEAQNAATKILRRHNQLGEEVPVGFGRPEITRDPTVGWKMAYYKPQGHLDAAQASNVPLAISIAGTEGGLRGPHWINNRSLGTLSWKQEHIEAEVEKVWYDMNSGRYRNNDVLITGHSLGGNQASIFAYALLSKIYSENERALRGAHGTDLPPVDQGLDPENDAHRRIIEAARAKTAEDARRLHLITWNGLGGHEALNRLYPPSEDGHYNPSKHYDPTLFHLTGSIEHIRARGDMVSRLSDHVGGHYDESGRYNDHSVRHVLNNPEAGIFNRTVGRYWKTFSETHSLRFLDRLRIMHGGQVQTISDPKVNARPLVRGLTHSFTASRSRERRGGLRDSVVNRMQDRWENKHSQGFRQIFAETAFQWIRANPNRGALSFSEGFESIHEDFPLRSEARIFYDRLAKPFEEQLARVKATIEATVERYGREKADLGNELRKLDQKVKYHRSRGEYDEAIRLQDKVIPAGVKALGRATTQHNNAARLLATINTAEHQLLDLSHNGESIPTLELVELIRETPNLSTEDKTRLRDRFVEFYEWRDLLNSLQVISKVEHVRFLENNSTQRQFNFSDTGEGNAERHARATLDEARAALDSTVRVAAMRENTDGAPVVEINVDTQINATPETITVPTGDALPDLRMITPEFESLSEGNGANGSRRGGAFCRENQAALGSEGLPN